MAIGKKRIDVTSRVAARPQEDRSVVVSREPATSAAKPSFQAVSRRAFEIWEGSGRLPGRDLENWLQAESELRSSSS